MLLICYTKYIRTNEIASFLPMLIAVAFIVIDTIEIIKERKANNEWNKKVGGIIK
jgi:hypothetical protein